MPPRKKPASRVLQLRIELNDSSPLVWRRFLIREDVLLIELHNTVQTVMGWWNSHLHRFEIEGKGYWNGGDESYDEEPEENVETTLLSEVLRPTTKSFFYDYDFGDGWRHTITIENTFSSEEILGHVPRCLAGENACPPEDVGAMPGFEHFKKAMKKSGTKAFREQMEWHGSEFHATSFCPNLVNREIQHLMMFEWREKPKSLKGTLLQGDPYRSGK